MAAFAWLSGVISASFTPDDGGGPFPLEGISQVGERQKRTYFSAEPAPGKNLPDPDQIVLRYATDVAVTSPDYDGHDDITPGTVGTLTVDRKVENKSGVTKESVTYTKMMADIVDNITLPGTPAGRVQMGRLFVACAGHTRDATES